MNLKVLVNRKLQQAIEPLRDSLAEGGAKSELLYWRMVGKIEGMRQFYAEIEGLLGEEEDNSDNP